MGNAVMRHFAQCKDFDVTATYRTEAVRPPQGALRFDALEDELEKLPSDFAYVINCIGLIKPFVGGSTVNAIELNALFPWRLVAWCQQKGMRLLHITSDCVFSGAKGRYVESDPHDALDVYGKTKSLGEPDDAMVLRTSIIGEELHKNASLVAWAMRQRGKTIDGYATHLWNGMTTGYYAKVCENIIRENLWEPGLFHLFARNDVSKLEMLDMFNKKYNLHLYIRECHPDPIDRTLRTEKDLCGKLEIPTVLEMVEEM